MTQDVDSDTYYAVGTRLFELADDVFDAFAVNVRILGETGSMAGTDDAGTAWATSYDARAKEVLDAVNDLTLAMQHYGGIVIQAGYNHAVAEYNAIALNGLTTYFDKAISSKRSFNDRADANRQCVRYWMDSADGYQGQALSKGLSGCRANR